MSETTLFVIGSLLAGELSSFESRHRECPMTRRFREVGGMRSRTPGAPVVRCRSCSEFDSDPRPYRGFVEFGPIIQPQLTSPNRGSTDHQDRPQHIDSIHALVAPQSCTGFSPFRPKATILNSLRSSRSTHHAKGSRHPHGETTALTTHGIFFHVVETALGENIVDAQ